MQKTTSYIWKRYTELLRLFGTMFQVWVPCTSRFFTPIYNIDSWIHEVSFLGHALENPYAPPST